MKKIIFSALLAVVVVAAIAFAEFFPTVIVTGIGGKWIDTRAYTSIATAITAIGGNERVLIVVGEEAVGTLTIPINVQLKFLSNGSLAVATQLTLQTYDIDAGDHEIFSGAGDIDFASGSVVRSAWFNNLDEALDVTSDDTLTMVISRAETLTADAEVGACVTLRWESPLIITDGGFTLSGLKKIEAGIYQIFSGANDFDFLAGSIIHSSWFVDLRRAITFTSDENVELTILVDQPETIDSDITIDLYQSLRIEKGCIITITTGDTFTIEGGIQAGIYKIFNEVGTGLVAFSKSHIKELYPQWWGALGDGVVDDSVPIQAAIDAANAMGGAIVQFVPGTYKCNVITKTGVVLSGGLNTAFPEDLTTPVLLANATGYIVDTPVGLQRGIGVQGLTFKGLGSATPCVGLRFQNVKWGFIQGNSFYNFADEAIIHANGLASRIRDNLITKSLLDRTRGSRTGCLAITGGSDLMISGNEISASCEADVPAYTMNAAMWVNAVYDDSGGNNFYEGNVFELSDSGLVLSSTTNRLINCRADLNYGHGFELTMATQNLLSNCLAYNNSNAVTGTYDGFHLTTGTSLNYLSNCAASSTLGVDHRFGFYSKTSNHTLKNKMVNCYSYGHSNEPGFDNDDDGHYGASITWGIGPPEDIGDDVTPSIAQGHFFRIDQTGGALTINNFDDSVNGQIIYLLPVDALTTLDFDGGLIVTNTGADKTLASGKVYTFYMFNGVWYETE